MEKIRTTRIQSELNQLQRQKLTKKLPNNISFEPILNDGVLDGQKLKITFTGRSGTIWESYKKIVGILEFPNNYPIDPPSFKFNDNFKHIHVYQGGNVCLPLITQDLWDTKTTVLNILIQIEDLIHRNPNLASPANSDLSNLYQSNYQEYEKLIIKQAEIVQNQN